MVKKRSKSKRNISIPEIKEMRKKKTRLTLSVNEYSVNRAKEMGLNLSELFDFFIKIVVKACIDAQLEVYQGLLEDDKKK